MSSFLLFQTNQSIQQKGVYKSDEICQLQSISCTVIILSLHNNEIKTFYAQQRDESDNNLLFWLMKLCINCDVF